MENSIISEKVQIKDVLHLYLGCECLADNVRKGRLSGLDKCQTDNSINMLTIRFSDDIDDDWAVFNDGEELSRIKPILRPISDITDGELTFCGKLLCAIPNHPSKEFDWKIERCHNTVGMKYFSSYFTSAQYFSIWNEKNKPDTVGHVEVGWFDFEKIDKRKKDHWRLGGNHKLTALLLSFGIDLFNLIPQGLALDKHAFLNSNHTKLC